METISYSQFKQYIVEGNVGKLTIGPETINGTLKGDMDGFETNKGDIEEAYRRAIEQAQFEIIVANAYFFPGLNFRHALVDAAERGVRELLMLQGRTDHRLLHYASHALYGSFLDAGIEIHEYHKSMLHAKVAVIDEHWATVGSSNLDPFSLLLALEANVIVDDEKFAKELKYSLEQAVKMGAMRVYEKKLRAQTTRMRLASWLCYGLVRFLIGIAGYAQGKARLTEADRKGSLNGRRVSH